MEWAEINGDVLRQIAKEVGDIVDIIRLRAVCKHWRSVVHPSDVPPQLPWFISFDHNFTGNSPRVVRAFSICSNKTYYLPWDPLYSVVNSTSSSGFLYETSAFSSDKFSNPLTGVEVPFPFPLNIISSLSSSFLTDVSSTSKPCFDKQCEDIMMFTNRGMNPDTGMNSDISYSSFSLWRYCKQKLKRIYEICCGVSKSKDVINNTSNPHLHKQCMDVMNNTSNPHLNKQCMDVMFTKLVMSKDLRSSNTSLWRYCKQKWTRIFEVCCSDWVWLHSYCNGKLYVVNCRDVSKTNVIDVATSKIVSVIQNPPQVYIDYLIDACGDLLGIQYLRINGHLEFQIYRLDDATENPCWTQLNEGIGDRMLFLSNGKNGGFCLEASGFAGLRGNCIYVCYGNGGILDGWKKLERYDLSQRKSEILLELNVRCSNGWFVPRLC